MEDIKKTVPYFALEMMLNFTLEAQSKRQDCRSSLSPIAWLKEYCTVKFSLPRQSGHTTLGLHFAHNLFVNSFFLTCKDNMRQRLEGIAYQNQITNITFRSFERLNTDYFRGMSIDACIIDTASFMSKSKEDDLYNIVAPISVVKNKFIMLFLE